MKHSKIQDFLQVFPRVLQSLLTASYLGAYRYYTLEPIEEIERCQQEIDRCQDEKSKKNLVQALKDFRRTKEDELSFVAKAVNQDLLNPSILRLSKTL